MSREPTIVRTFFPSGGIKSQKRYINEKLNGICRDYHENGNVKDEISYVNDKKNGISKFYDRNKNLTRETYYISDKKYGIEKSYFCCCGDYKLASETTYYDGIEHGMMIRFNKSNGNIAEEKPYFKGKIHGENKFYFSNGRLAIIIPYIDNKKEGEEIHFHNNGKISKKISYCDGLPNGIYIEFYNTGIVKSQMTCRMGKVCTSRKEYYESGVLKKETFYNKYKKIIKYYENGNISEKINRNFGVLDGEQLKYTRDGSLVSKIIYDNGCQISKIN
jgi:antitoxin component YwqK of YwqJK toxin-antitoxin module